MPNTMYLIRNSWICIAIALLCGLIAIRTSQASVGKQIKILDNDYAIRTNQAVVNEQSDNAHADNKVKKFNSTNYYSYATLIFSFVSLFLVIIGIGFLCYFSYSNLPQQPSAVDNPSTSKPKIDGKKTDQRSKTQQSSVP